MNGDAYTTGGTAGPAPVADTNSTAKVEKLVPRAFLQDIITKIQKTADVKVAFGEPIMQEGVTVIPVAKVMLAGGGGGGGGKQKEGATEGKRRGGGLGMGTKVITDPVGYIKIRQGEAVYQPIVNVNKIATGGLIVGGLMMVMLMKVFSAPRSTRD